MLAGTKVATSVGPHWTRCAYDMIFEHLYVEYLYLKYPVARPVKKSYKSEGKKEGKPKSPTQETDMVDLILQSNAKESPSPKTRKGGARILIDEEAKVGRKN